MKRALKTMTLGAAAVLAAGVASNASAQFTDDTIKIGFITDMSSVYADVDGPAGVEAIRMAIADFGGTLNGKKIELIFDDHHNKTDIASARVREWFDQQGLDVLIGGQNSATNLAMARVAAEKKKPFIAVGSAVARLTNEDCTPYTVHYVFDTVALAKGPGTAIVKQGGKEWYFLSVDYAFGHSLEKDTTKIIEENGGKVIGSVRHPLGTADFSSFLLQAQASGAKILGIANSGNDTINAIKAAKEFGITNTMQLASMVMFLTDTHSLGLETAQSMFVTAAWYWDQTPESREWSQRFYQKINRMPTVMQAGNYSAVTQYLKVIEALGTDDGDKVMAGLKSTPINDMFAKDAYIRADGRMVHDMYLMQIKTPAESKYPWDYYKLVRTIPGEEAFTTKAESTCSLWK